MNETSHALHVDRVINKIIAERSGAGPAPEPGVARPMTDEDLVAELAGLSVIDWPADEVGERIVRGVATRVGPAQSPAPGHATSSRVVAGVGAVAAALLIVLALFGLWQSGSPGPGTGRLLPGSTRTSGVVQVTVPQRGTMRHGAAPAGTSADMQLVDSMSSPFRSVGSGPQTPNLQCETASVCYAWGIGQGGGDIERTTDGGATWLTLPALPGNRSLVQSASWSCPAVGTCVAMAGPRQLAVTTDGGARWNIESVPVPPGSSGAAIDQVSCPTARDCVAHLYGPGTFLTTADGGRTWTAARSIPKGSPAGMWLLRCDADGECIGLDPVGTATDDELAVMRSADYGRSWAAYSVHLPPTGPLLLSCGDARHCMVVTTDPDTMTTTSDGGRTWQERAAPRSWPNTATALSCATGLDCFIAVSQFSPAVLTPTGRGALEHAAIEATYNGGSTWTTISVPPVAGSPLAVISPLSCPGPDGCIAVAATARQEETADGREILSSFPARSRPVAGG